MSGENLTEEEKAALEVWREHIRAGEAKQIHELITQCDNKYQFAKTHSVYVKDWEKTKESMERNLNYKKLPPDTSAELYRAMIDVTDEIMEEKFKAVREAFSMIFDESIYNFLGKDGKTKSFFGLFGSEVKNKSIAGEENKYNGYAVTGFVFSLISILGVGLLGIIGFILGIVALNKIKHTHEKGKGLAIAAIIIGFLRGFAVGIFRQLEAGGY